MFCREQVARLMSHQDAIERTGATMAAIGNGTPDMARAFVAQFEVRFPVFTDPERNSYRLAGMKRSFGLGINSFRQARRALAAGHRQGFTAGDPWQQGGILIVAQGGAVCWRHVNSDAGDNVDGEHVLAALTAALPTHTP